MIKKLLKKELNKYPQLKKFNMVELMYRQAKKESSLNPKAERYEKHIDDSSVGLFQLLTTTIRQLGFKGTEDEMFKVKVQIKYAMKYINFLYEKFGEVHNEIERLKLAFASYNCGRGNINEAIKELLDKDGIKYDGVNTIQGSWSNYNRINKALKDYNIISKRNANINSMYIEYIFRDVEVLNKKSWLGNTLGMINNAFK